MLGEVLDVVLPEFILENIGDYVFMVDKDDWEICICRCGGLYFSLCARGDELVVYVLEEGHDEPLEIFDGGVHDTDEIRDVIFANCFRLLDE